MPAVAKGVARHRAALGPIMSEQLAVGTAFPKVEIDFGFPPERVDLAERVKGKRVIVVGLPGAFTPT
jgi:peroxiredoxin